MRNKLILGLVIISLIGVLFLINVGARPPACVAHQVSDSSLMRSLMRYEQWLRQYEDPEWIYIRERGYPMCLYSFGIMYARLYQLTCDFYYRERFLRIAHGAERIRNDDWTWSFYDGTGFSTHPDAKSSLYNAMFSELFIEAYLLTRDAKYKIWADAAIKKIEDTLPSHKTYNYFFLPFTTIAQYCYEIGCSKESIALGKKLYDQAPSGYDAKTGVWYYNPAERRRNFYDGQSAFYQMGQIAWFLDKSFAIKEIFPEEHQELSNLLAKTSMVKRVTEYMLPTGTFFYSKDVPDYTESAGNTLYAFALLSRFLEEDYGRIIESARKTILARQAPEGGFYKSPMESTLELWFGDNIAADVARYLYLIAKTENINIEAHK